MDIVETRFKNFKEFIKSIPGIDDTYIVVLEQVSVELFLKGLAQYSDKPIHEIIKLISLKASIDLNTIPIETKQKFSRYIVYFQEINKL